MGLEGGRPSRTYRHVIKREFPSLGITSPSFVRFSPLGSLTFYAKVYHVLVERSRMVFAGDLSLSVPWMRGRPPL